MILGDKWPAEITLVTSNILCLNHTHTIRYTLQQLLRFPHPSRDRMGWEVLPPLYAHAKWGIFLILSKRTAKEPNKYPILAIIHL